VCGLQHLGNWEEEFVGVATLAQCVLKLRETPHKAQLLN